MALALTGNLECKRFQLLDLRLEQRTSDPTSSNQVGQVHYDSQAARARLCVNASGAGTYVNVLRGDGIETISGAWTFAPTASNTTPFTLGSNALGVQVAGLHAQYLSDQNNNARLATINPTNDTIPVRKSTGTIRAATPDGTVTDELTTVSYVNARISGANQVKDACLCSTTANFDLTTGGLSAVDGVTIVDGNRVLVRFQTTASQNGIYDAHSGSWTRSSDSDSNGGATPELAIGNKVFVQSGTLYGACGFELNSAGADPIVIGTTTMFFTQVSGNVTYSATSGITLTGTQFSLDQSFAATWTAKQTFTLATSTSTFTSGEQGVSVATSTLATTTSAVKSSPWIGLSANLWDAAGGGGGGASATKTFKVQNVAVSALLYKLQIGSSDNANILTLDGGTMEAKFAGTITTALSASKYVKTDASSSLTVVTSIPATDISSGAALTTGTADANVIITLGGTPSTSLLAASSITMSWSGTLATARGGLGADLSANATGGLVWKNGSTTFGSTGALSGIVQGNGAGAPTAITGTAGKHVKWGSSAPYLTNSILSDDGTDLTVTGGIIVSTFSTPGGIAYVGSSGRLTTTGALTGVLLGAGSGAPTVVTGTAGKHVKWGSGGLTLADSVISDDGTDATLTGNLNMVSGNLLLSNGIINTAFGGFGAVQNGVIWSQDFNNSRWVKTNCTVTDNSTTAPDGTATADRINPSTVAGRCQSNFNSFAGANTTWTVSCWVKAVSGTKNVRFGICDSSNVTKMSNVFSATTTWTRFSVTVSVSIPDFSVPFIESVDDTTNFYAWGMQWNKGAIAPYLRTEDNIFIGSDVGTVFNGTAAYFSAGFVQVGRTAQTYAPVFGVGTGSILFASTAAAGGETPCEIYSYYSSGGNSRLVLQSSASIFLYRKTGSNTYQLLDIDQTRGIFTPDVQFTGNALPFAATGGSSTCGTSANRWATVYAVDLNASGNVTGTWAGTTLSIAKGGTGQVTAAAAFNALSPMTTLGDLIYGGTSGAGTRLAGNTTANKMALFQTGNGTASAAPVWAAIAEGDVTNLTSDLALKAPLASPTFTGTPAAPTATVSTNTTQIATTAFVIAQLAASSPGLAPVQSVFGRTGTVVAVSTDYSSVGITNTAIGASNPSTGAFTTLSATGAASTGALTVTGAASVSTNLTVSGTITSGLINGQTVSSSANLTGTLALAGAATFASTLAVGAITSSGAFNLGSNTITSGLINGQTISNTANFTDIVTVATRVNVPGMNQNAFGLTFVIGSAINNAAGGTVTDSYPVFGYNVSFLNTTSNSSAYKYVASDVASIVRCGSTIDFLVAASGTALASVAFTKTLSISTTGITVIGTLAATNISGTNTGDQTITLTSEVTGSGTGSFATTITKSITPTWTGLHTFNAGMLVSFAGNALTVQSTGSNGASIIINPVVAGQQASVFLYDAGTQKWQIAKGTDNSFNIYDTANSTVRFTVLGAAIGMTGALTVSGNIAAANFSGSHAGTSTGTNTGDQTISITGDVSASGSTGVLAATITTSFVGHASITTLGTITAGTWNAGALTANISTGLTAFADVGIKAITTATATSNTTHKNSPAFQLVGKIWTAIGQSTRTMSLQLQGLTGVDSGYQIAWATNDASILTAVGTTGALTTGAALTVTGLLTCVTSTVLSVGSTTAAPLLFQSGTSLTTPVAGAMEYDGTGLFFTLNTHYTSTNKAYNRRRVAQVFVVDLTTGNASAGLHGSLGGTTIAVNHYLGSLDLICTMWENTAGVAELVLPDVLPGTDPNVATLSFGTAPTSGQYRVAFVG